MEPALYIVATPIGNLGDMSTRARSVLAGASVIAAEDTRRTGQLLNHEGIDTPMMAYHEHSPSSVAASIVERIAAGEAVAPGCPVRPERPARLRHAVGKCPFAMSIRAQ